MTISLNGLRISHARYDAAYEAMMDAIEFAGEASVCIPFLGPTRVGKSDALSALREQLSRDRCGPGSMIPTPSFVEGAINPKPNDSEIYASIIRTMGRVSANSKLALLQERMFNLIEQRGVRIIALDECSHCAEPGANLTRRAAADHFKTIIDRSSSILILTGLPKFQRLIDENEQFAARSMATVELHPYRWTDPEDRNEFVTVVYSILDYLVDNGIDVDLDWGDVARRLFAASGGRVGMCVELVETALRSLESGHVLTLSVLGKAARVRLQTHGRGAPLFEPEPPEDAVLLRAYATVMREAGLSLPNPNTSMELDAFRETEGAMAA